MQARIKHPVMVFPAALKALHALGSATGDTLPESTRNLVYLRASQINGCSVCLEMHATDMRKAGESDERIFTVAGWRDAPYFSDAERAALALTEATTRIADRADGVPDDVWDEAAAHYDEEQLAALVLAIASINTWNRLNAATRAVAGSHGG
ncbi:carboxymuconolactone decarboxylase family protein [Dactylosporangium sp. NBC_01737]|uniref:carboxymuconolactone decarboxylase family protein n=1 Tax=Dactylosporangium sp. NBC_01737 TaxID=2975959 RepID=UPI002E0FAE62|nr:carboxymuconolactone decarboxylase family protein [Dactylosporangium sp. NBC_01737]